MNDPERDVRASWNAGAEAWQHFIHSGADYYRLFVHGPALLSRCLPVDGQRVLDVGCGEGYFSRELARCGARVVGVDVSDALLRFAREREDAERLGIEYRQVDARHADSQWPPGSFDLATGCMSIHDMEDAGGVLAAAGKLLRPEGRIRYSVPHPCTDTPYRAWERGPHGEKLALKIDRYFETGPAVMEWNMERLTYPWTTPFWRRTLEEWVSLTTGAGFVLQGLHEPRPSDELVRAHPELDDCFRVPYFLILEAQRPA